MLPESWKAPENRREAMRESGEKQSEKYALPVTGWTVINMRKIN